MGKFVRCPLPCHTNKHQFSDSDQFSQHPTNHLHSESSSSSSTSNSSLSSQSSLPSIPSLTPHSQTLDHSAAHRCSATLSGHSSYVFSISLSGNRLFTGGSNGQIRVWDLTANPQNHVVLEGRSAVKSIVVLNDLFFTAHHDHKIRVWRITEDHDDDHDNSNNENNRSKVRYKLVATLPTVSDRCMKLFSAKNYVEIRRHKKCTWVHHVDTVSGLALSHDGLFLYSVSWDRTIKVWRSRDFKCVESIQNAHDDAINAVVSSRDGLVITGSADKLIKVWKREDKNDNKRGKHSLVAVLEKHKSAINALALSENGSILYSGACDRSIIVWERRGDGGGGGWEVAGALRGHRKAILCWAVVGELLCSGSADKTVRVWRRGSGNSYFCLAVFEGHKSPVKCLTACLDFNRDGNDGEMGKCCLVYSGGLDFDIKVWQLLVPS